MLGYKEIPFQHFNDIGAFLWGGSMEASIPKSSWKEFENVQKHFSYKISSSREINAIIPPTS